MWLYVYAIVAYTISTPTVFTTRLLLLPVSFLHLKKKFFGKFVFKQYQTSKGNSGVNRKL